jgi:hypothetical protein
MSASHGNPGGRFPLNLEADLHIFFFVLPSVVISFPVPFIGLLDPLGIGAFFAIISTLGLRLTRYHCRPPVGDQRRGHVADC